MNLIREATMDAALGVGVGVGVADAPKDLSMIRKPGCAAVIWRRTPPPGFQTWIDALPPERLPQSRIVLRPNMVRSATREVFDIAETPAGPERDWLLNDVTSLAGMFAKLMDAPFLRVRFDVITTNACRKFHIDAVTARLVCTYHGLGTQYGISTGGADPEHVFTTPTGSPILLRGTRWPTQPRSGLLHRSPPIEGTGETRLVLVLDPLEEFEEEI